MRHHYNRFLEVNSGVQKKSNLIRNMLTSLIEHKRVTTTPKKAKVLKYEAEKLFAKLVKTYNRFDNKDDALREVKRILLANTFGGDKIVNKAIDDKLMQYVQENRRSGFARLYRVGMRKWDNVEKVMVELI